MEESAQPEMATSDLSSLALQLAQWGCDAVLLTEARSLAAHAYTLSTAYCERSDEQF